MVKNNNYYLQHEAGEVNAIKKVFFTGNKVIDTAYYTQRPYGYRTLMTEIIPVLDSLTDINFILPADKEKSAVLLEYVKLLNITDINFIAPEDISEVKELKELLVDSTHNNESMLSLNWFLKYRGLITSRFNFKKIVFLSKKSKNITEEILEFLKIQNFFIVTIEDTPIAHLINLFAGAEQIVTAINAGVINAIYCNNKSKILEISSSDSRSNMKYITCISSLLPHKIKLTYTKIRQEELHCFQEKFNQFFTT